ncbi:DUF488 family protein [Nocardia sp. NEAU-G5]|uniref:DUF488 family protein n=1 Tax=Nocardia albiluteola TaxID=2842303 RepID=A0ABS6B1I6_9NOCA|nr:DUF488 family protein [Nocardia albiluteola]MBU3063088.1 DUF488 family protein [Nocardia albiluteola]
MAQQPAVGFRVKRVYDEPDPEDGYRVLVDRLWPRGVSKQRARIDEWMKAVTPSEDLRRWFHADPDHRAAEFARKYGAELADDEHQEALARLRELGEAGPVTLVTAVRDPIHSHVTVLLEQLRS